MIAYKAGRPMETTPKTANQWAAKTDRFEFDQWLRQSGFQIVSRPNKGPVLWKKAGTVMTEAMAMTILAKRKSV